MNETIIVTESAKNMRSLAWHTLKGHWIDAFAALFIVQMVSDLPGIITDSLGIESRIVFFLTSLYTIIVSGPLTIGLAKYFLQLFRRQPVNLQIIKEPFSYVRKAMALYVNIVLRVMLWSFFLIIPGIVKAYSYSQAYMILADNPEKDPYTCMDESQQMMFGNRMKLFLLQLSYIGWNFLFSLPSAIYNAVLNQDVLFNTSASDPFRTALVMKTDLIYTLLSFLALFARAYLMTGEACFYELLTGNLAVVSSNPHANGEGFSPNEKTDYDAE